MRGRELSNEVNKIIFIFIVLAFLFALFNGSGITGLFSYEQRSLDLKFNSTQNYSLEIASNPLSLSVSGFSTGPTAVYLVSNSSKLLVANGSGSFSDVCVETCDLDNIPNKFDLLIEVENATFTLNDLKYLRSDFNNSAPVWVSNITSFNVFKNTSIDLDYYFFDPDNDSLTYVVTSDPLLELMISNNVLTISPLPSFESANISLIASDGNTTVKQPILISRDPSAKQTPSAKPLDKIKIRPVNKYGSLIGIYHRNDSDVDFEFSPLGKSKNAHLKLRGVRAFSDLSPMLDTVSDSSITTEVLALDNVEVESAELVLPKYGVVNSIKRCPDFDFETFACPSWTSTTINFTDNQDSISFTVDSFSAYGGSDEVLSSGKDLGGADTTFATISSCQNLSSPGVYELDQDVTAPTHCMNITGERVTLDCKGHTIYYGTSPSTENYGVYVLNSNNATIINCSLHKPSTGGSNGVAIVLLGGNYSSISFNKIQTNGIAYGRGMLLYLSNNNSILNNTVHTNGSDYRCSGFYVRESSFNNFVNNTVNTDGYSENYAVEMLDAPHNFFEFNALNASGFGVGSETIEVTRSGDSLFSHNTLESDVGYIFVKVDSEIYNFTNTTFKTDSGSIYFPGLFQTDEKLIINKSNLNILQNNAFLNSTNLTFMNTSAQITLHDVIYNYPEIQVDYEDDGTYTKCFDCINESYNGSTFVFNVSHFTSFQLSEESVPPNVTDLTPPSGSEFDTEVVIEVGANITDNIAVANATINITEPDNNVVEINLSSNAGTEFYNTSYRIPAKNGTYTVNFFANDTSGNINDTESIFIVGSDTCGVLTSSKNLSNDVSATGTCFDIKADDVVLDCKGNRIEYDSSGNGNGYGVNISGRDNITVTNCSINDVNAGGTRGYGVYLGTATNNKINNNTIQTNGTSYNFGIYLENSADRNSILNNSINTKGTTDFNYGVHMWSSKDNEIGENTIYTNGTTDNYGIYFYLSDNNSIWNNSINAKGSENSNRGIYFWSSKNNELGNNTIKTNGTSYNYGILLYSSSNNNSVLNNAISVGGSQNSNYGVMLNGATDNKLRGNTIQTNGTYQNYGLLLFSSSNNNILLNNSISAKGTGFTNYGVYLYGVRDNELRGNAIQTNGTYNNHGIYLESSSKSNSFLYNGISSGGSIGTNYGVYVRSSSDNNTFSSNLLHTIGNSGYGVRIESSGNNTFYNQTFDNTVAWIWGEGSNSGNNFTRTVFQTLDGSINTSFFQINNSHYINKSNLNISQNNAFLNSTNLTFMNTSATITLDDLPYDAVNVQVDYDDDGTYETCSDCVQESYNGSTFVFNVPHFTSYQAGEADTCGVLTSSKNLSNDVSATGTCFDIEADDVVLDCKGYRIEYDSSGNGNGYGVNITGVNNATVRNCTIQDVNSGGGDGYGIRLAGSNNIIRDNRIQTNGTVKNYAVYLGSSNTNGIFNNTLRTFGSGENHALFLSGSDLNNVSGNNFGAYGYSSSYGVFISVSDNNIIEDNTILANGTTQDNYGVWVSANAVENQIVRNSVATNGTRNNYGIYLSSNANSNNLSNNTILASGRQGSNYGIYFSGVSSNFVSNNDIFTNGTTSNYGVYLATSTHNKFSSNFFSPKGSSTYHLVTGSSQNNYFENTVLDDASDWIYTAIAGDSLNLSGTAFLTGSGVINVTGLSVLEDIQLVTRAKLNISQNSAFLNSTNLTFMNTSAQITLHDVIYNYPEIQVDYEDDGTYTKCFDCINESYNGSTMVFNVSHFTSYQLSEESVPPNVTDLTPESGSEFETEVVIEVGANITDNIAVANATINITEPDNNVVEINLSSNAGTEFYNTSYRIPAKNGTYTVNFFANDTSGNINDTESIFIVGSDSCGTLTSSKNLTNDVSTTGTCFDIEADDTVLDCKGNRIEYDSSGNGDSYGVNVSGRVNITVRNCTIVDINQGGNQGYGIYLLDTNNSKIVATDIFTNGTNDNYGVYLRDSVSNNLTQTSIETQGSAQQNYGVYLWGSTGISIDTCSIIANGTNNNNGVYSFFNSDEAVIRNSNISGLGSGQNNYGLFFNGVNLNELRSNKIATQGDSGNWVVYFSDSDNNTLINNSLFSSDTGDNNVGLYLIGVDYNVISSNTIVTNGTDSDHGIDMSVSNFNNISNNLIKAFGGDGNDGIRASSSNDNTLYNNTIHTNGTSGSEGISLDSSSNNTFSDNVITTLGLLSYGISLSNSNNTFSGTQINNTVKWIDSQSIDNKNNFTGTVFVSGAGNLNVTALFYLEGTHKVNSTNLNISSNKAFLNSTNLTFMNISAEITLNDLSFDVPKIEVDYQDDGTFEQCTAPQCINQSYNGSTLVFNVSHFTSYQAAESDTCGVLTSSKNLTNDVSAGLSCFTIDADDVVLDCKGHRVEYGADGVDLPINVEVWGINISDVNNVTVKNCEIVDVNSSGHDGWGIYIARSENATILNNFVQTNGTELNYPLYIFSDSHNATIINNTFYAEGSAGANYGVYVRTSDSANFTENTIRGDGSSDGYGVYLLSANEHTFINNTIIGYSDTAMYVRSSIMNNIANNIVSTTGSGTASALYLSYAHNNTVEENNISSGAATTSNKVLNLDQSNNNILIGNYIFTNGGSSNDLLRLSLSNNNLIVQNVLEDYTRYGSAINLGFANNTFLNNTLIQTGGEWVQSTGVDNRNNFTGTAYKTRHGMVNITDFYWINGSVEFGNESLNITENQIFLKSSELTFLNTSATITLHDVFATYPEVQADYDDDGTYTKCFDCINESYNGSTVVFNATHFTSFQLGEETVPPNVTGLVPAENSNFEFGALIEVGANVTDDFGVSNVSVNITLPNSTIVLINLSANAGLNFYNTSYTIPSLPGTYNVRFIANDTADNFNTSETTFFVGGSICSVLTESINLTNDVSSTGTCFDINADDIILDCKGKRIEYDSSGNGGVGVNASSYNNITVKNCIIADINSGGRDGHGIYLDNSNLSLIYNNSIQTNGTISNYGVELLNTSNNTVLANIIYTRGTGGSNYGVRLRNTSFSDITENQIQTNGDGSGNDGVYVHRSFENEIKNNTVSTYGSANDHAIRLDSSHLNRLINNTLVPGGESGHQGVYLSGADNNTITNNTISTSATVGIQLTGGSNKNTILTNRINGSSGVSMFEGPNYIFNNTIFSFGSGITIENEESAGSIIEYNTIQTNGTNSYGLNLVGTLNITIKENLIKTNGPSAYALFVDTAWNTSLINNIFYNTTQWIRQLDSETAINYTGTTFRTTQGSINVTSLFHINGSQDVTVDNLNISQNRAFINSTDLTFMNISSTITLDNVFFSNPEVQVDREDDNTYTRCTDCINISYNGSTFIFNVSSWTSYRAGEETVPPNVTDLTPSNGTVFTTGDIIEVGANVTDNYGVANVTINITEPDNNIVEFNLSANSGLSFYNTSYTVPDKNGTYLVLFTANDTTGNVNSSEFIFIVGNDTVFPNITVLLPINNTLFNQSDIILVRANVTDNLGIYSVTALLVSNVSSETYELTHSTGDIYEVNITNATIISDYNITLLARDTNQNLNDTEKANFTVLDSTPPAILATSPSNGTVVTQGISIGVGANVTDNVAVSNVSVNITLPNSTIVPLNLSKIDSNFYNVSYNFPQSGTYTILFIANDTRNFINNTFSITVSTTTPTPAPAPTGGSSGGGSGSTRRSVQPAEPVQPVPAIPPMPVPAPSEREQPQPETEGEVAESSDVESVPEVQEPKQVTSYCGDGYCDPEESFVSCSNDCIVEYGVFTGSLLYLLLLVVLFAGGYYTVHYLRQDHRKRRVHSNLVKKAGGEFVKFITYPFRKLWEFSVAIFSYVWHITRSALHSVKVAVLFILSLPLFVLRPVYYLFVNVGEGIGKAFSGAVDMAYFIVHIPGYIIKIICGAFTFILSAIKSVIHKIGILLKSIQKLIRSCVKSFKKSTKKAIKNAHNSIVNLKVKLFYKSKQSYELSTVDSTIDQCLSGLGKEETLKDVDSTISKCLSKIQKKSKTDRDLQEVDDNIEDMFKRL